MSRSFQSATLFAALAALVSSGCCLPQAIIQNPTISNIVYGRPLLSRVIGTPACGRCACSDSAFIESYSELPSDIVYLDDSDDGFPATFGSSGCNCGGSSVASSEIVSSGTILADENSAITPLSGFEPTLADESDKKHSDSTVPSTVLDAIEPPASLDKPEGLKANSLPAGFVPVSL